MHRHTSIGLFIYKNPQHFLSHTHICGPLSGDCWDQLALTHVHSTGLTLRSLDSTGLTLKSLDSTGLTLRSIHSTRPAHWAYSSSAIGQRSDPPLHQSNHWLEFLCFQFCEAIWRASHSLLLLYIYILYYKYDQNISRDFIPTWTFVCCENCVGFKVLIALEEAKKKLSCSM